MPGPVIYVAVAISAVAAVIVFKEVCLFVSLTLRGYRAHPMAISSFTTLISVQDSPPGRTLVNAGKPDLICILYPLRRRPLLKVMREPGCLSEAPGARRNRLSDHQNLATHRILTYSI